MDFLDSLDLDVSKYKKSHRVRSWYLYEQFKSLERNQLDAARKLKSRSYQDKILRQELSERKARRKLYDQFELSQSESGIERSLKSQSTKTSLNASCDDFIESFHELQEDEGTPKIVVQDLLDDSSQDNLRTEKNYDDDFISADEPKDDQSCKSVESVVNVKSEETLTEDIQKYFVIEKETQFQDLSFDAVKEKLQCLERLAQMKDFDNISENENSLYSIRDDESKQVMIKDKNVGTPDNNIYFMWSKLVSFAYQIMQLNHGNCYYDYGSQILTAVLACDVLRRGINRMCHILQPYVSPIKYTTDSESSMENHKNVKRKYLQTSKQCRTHKPKRYCQYSSQKSPRTKLEEIRKYRSENFWEQHSVSYSVEKKINGKKYRRASEPERRIPKLAVKRRNAILKPSSHTLWPCLSRDNYSKESLQINSCTCSCHKVVNPMLHLTRYLDRIMRDIDDPLFI